jgi:hypothetical protein
MRRRLLLGLLAVAVVLLALGGWAVAALPTRRPGRPDEIEPG